MKWVRHFWRWLRNKCFPSQLWVAVEVEDLPVTLEPRRVYLVGENEYLWYAVMICPCGCEEMLYLNLLPEQRPCWRIDYCADVPISIQPSIWRVTGCHSHFFVKGGKIEWCFDEVAETRAD